MIACAVSTIIVGTLIFFGNRRKAAVGTLTFPFLLPLLITILGRVELIAFLTFYLLSLPLQLVTTGSFLQQGSTALVVVTAVHAGVVVVLFWSLLANAIIATQVVEDGTMSSLIVCFHHHHITVKLITFVYQPLFLGSIVVFIVTVYISLDVGLGITTLIGGVSSPPEALKSIPLFVLTSIWPAL